MADEILRSKHAFGQLENVDAAIRDGKIDAYDILFLKDKDDKPTIGWIDKNGKKVILEDSDKKQVLLVPELPAVGDEEVIYICNSKFFYWDGKEYKSPIDEAGVSEEFVETFVDSKVKAAISEANAYANEILGSALEAYNAEKYEITNVPEGTLVDYREKEIRVMCPVGTKWVKQSVGPTGNANMYYMGFKAYAPEGAVSFKEGDRGVIIDKMYTFDDDFAGTDELGRNYSICWFALASYDASKDEWTYYGKNSSNEKYIGWTYVVEWYGENGKVIASDCIRVNLSNENCHSSILPSYVSAAIAEVSNGFEIVEF